MAEKSKQAEMQENENEEKNYLSYCVPGTFIDRKYTDALNAKHPDRERVVIHTRNADRSINWEESLILNAKSREGKPRLNPMTDEQKEKQGLDVKKEYYIVNFSDDHKDKLFINKRVGTEVRDGKEVGVYEKTTRDLSAQEFTATMKSLEPWHNYTRSNEAGAKEEEQAKAPAEKTPKAEAKETGKVVENTQEQPKAKARAAKPNAKTTGMAKGKTLTQ